MRSCENCIFWNRSYKDIEEGYCDRTNEKTYYDEECFWFKYSEEGYYNLAVELGINKD